MNIYKGEFCLQDLPLFFTFMVVMKKAHIISPLFVVFILADNISFSQAYWTQKASLPSTARFDAFSFSIGDKGYIGAGSDINNNFLNDFWEYDAVNNVWVQKSNFAGVARWQAVSFSIGSNGYVGTGGGSGYNKDFWEYNSSSDTWTQKASLPADGRTAAVGFSIGSKGYIGTGWGGSMASVNHNDFWEYDPSLNIWTQKANVPGNKRSYAVGLAIGNKGYIGTGADSLGRRDDFWEYDPMADAWTQKTNFPGGDRSDIDGGHFILGKYGYIGTGVSNSGHHNDFWQYYPANDIWLQVPILPSFVRMGVSNFSINNRGYICLGWNSTSICFNDLWEYTDTTLVGINETNFDDYFSVCPNPTDGRFKIQGSKFNIQEVQVYNTRGEKVHSSKPFSNSTTDISNLPNAVYFVHIICQEGKTVKKIILAK